MAKPCVDQSSLSLRSPFMGNEQEDRLLDIDRRLARIETFLEAMGMPKRAELPPAAPEQGRTPPPLPVAQIANPADEVPIAGVNESTNSTADRAEAESLDERGAVVHQEVVLRKQRSSDATHAIEATAVNAEPIVALSAEAESVKIAPPPLPSNALRPHVATVPSATGGFEQAIGLKLAGWIGAIVVVIGAAMGVKFAYDQGWLGGLPDTVKLGLFYAVGIALIGAGEWVYRRVHPLAAVGLYSAGVAGLFLVSYAGNAYYQLYEQPVAFALMAGACAIGAIISLRGGLVSIAILSLLGANIAPLVLRNRTVGEWPLLIYLLALQVLAIGLAHVGKGARWWILRNFALVTLSLWMTGRLIPSATAFSMPTVLFICLYATLFQIENALAARRQPADGRVARFHSFSHPTFSFAVTAALALALLRWSVPLSDLQRGAIAIALSMIAFTAGAASIFAKEVALRALAQSWLVQGGILLFAAVPVALSGPWIILAWVFMALGYVVLGGILKRERTATGGVIIWYAATLYLVFRSLLRLGGDPLGTTAFRVADVAMPTYFVIGLLVAAVGYVIVLLHGRHDRREPDEQRDVTPSTASDAVRLAQILAVTATALVAGMSVAALPSLGTTIAGVILAWICFALAMSSSRTATVFRALAATVITLALARWMAMDLIAERLPSAADGSPRRFVLNSTMGMGALCTMSLLAMGKLLGRRLVREVETQSKLIAGVVIFGLIAMTMGVSFEIERAVRSAIDSGRSFAWPAMQMILFAWTALWAIAAMALPWIAKLMGVGERTCRELETISTFAVSLIAIKFLLVDSLRYAVAGERGPVGAFVNIQTVVATMLVTFQIYSARTRQSSLARQFARTMIFLTPLVIGSLEIHRLVGPPKTLMTFSIFWGLYAVLSIILGFSFRAVVLRYVGLGLLGITLVKIVLIDLANAGTGWRILSFLGLGLILLATSVLYGRLSPKLLRTRDDDQPIPSPGENKS